MTRLFSLIHACVLSVVILASMLFAVTNVTTASQSLIKSESTSAITAQFVKPECISLGYHRIDCFVVDSNNYLQHTYWNGNAWGNWELLGVPIQLKSEPECLTHYAGVILDCFAIGDGQKMYQMHWNGSAWSAWLDMGGQFLAGTSPSCQWVVDRIDCFGIGLDYGVWHAYSPTGVGFSAWEPIGGATTGSPSCIGWFEGAGVTFELKFTCALIDKNTRAVSYIRYDNGWRSPVALGLQYLYAPTCLLWQTNILSCHVTKTDENVEEINTNETNGNPLINKSVFDAKSSYTPECIIAANNKHCFAVNKTTSALQHSWRTPSNDITNLPTTESLGGQLGITPGCTNAVWDQTRILCLGIGPDKTIWMQYWDGTRWSGWLTPGNLQGFDQNTNTPTPTPRPTQTPTAPASSIKPRLHLPLIMK